MKLLEAPALFLILSPYFTKLQLAVARDQRLGRHVFLAYVLCTQWHITFDPPPLWGKTGEPIWVMLYINLKLSSILIFEKNNITKVPNERSVRALAAKRPRK